MSVHFKEIDICKHTHTPPLAVVEPHTDNMFARRNAMQTRLHDAILLAWIYKANSTRCLCRTAVGTTRSTAKFKINDSAKPISCCARLERRTKN